MSDWKETAFLMTFSSVILNLMWIVFSFELAVIAGFVILIGMVDRE